jgi:hypothetical protein
MSLYHLLVDSAQRETHMPKNIRGTILYTSNQEHRRGHARGTEHFSITVHDDGSRALRSHCVIQDPPAVERDVLLSVTNKFHPISASVRIRIGDQAEGLSNFLFSDTQIKAFGKTIDGADYQETFALDKPATFFVTHPIQADAWLVSGLNVDPKEPTVRRVSHFPTCSNDHRGATGPQIQIHEPSIDIYFLGVETIEVKAGMFEAMHFCYGDPNEDPEGANEAGAHPRYHVWTSADGNGVLLKASVDGYMQTRYELIELVEGPLGDV